ncbi:MAG: methylenetetrahydrofolate reductase C-terminal domain-containing protein [Deltaproteobacteria bacterium]|nr:methylenetetrahydrofolate reductase C-terminal domain-containing protein [Deltaproteobacteria bacterium]
MIITTKKDPNDILESLKTTGGKSVYLFGCDTCAEQCKTGGAPEIKEMTGLLEKNGYKVTGSSLVDETCYNQLVRREFRQQDALNTSDTILVLSCGAGVKTVADNAKETQAVLPALDSTFLASVERVGRFFEGCSLCGDCVLDATAGICPHTDCPKGLLNGPCGGVDKGKCEVNRGNDCAWIRIYARLKAQGRLELMTRYTPPKDHSVSVKPRTTLLR